MVRVTKESRNEDHGSYNKYGLRPKAESKPRPSAHVAFGFNERQVAQKEILFFSYTTIESVTIKS